ncbi:MAG: hypothetical protein PHF72_11780 [Gammaproteobacteria bacterium]|nr:hypothetical protein [Gammaproteobacteria bacterium]
MKSRFSQLAVGQRFELDSEDWIKISPLLARSEAAGHQRMIPRSTAVTPAGTLAATPAEPAPALKPALVRAALRVHRDRCLGALEPPLGTLPPRDRDALLAALDDAYRALLRQLGL